MHIYTHTCTCACICMNPCIHACMHTYSCTHAKVYIKVDDDEEKEVVVRSTKPREPPDVPLSLRKVLNVCGFGVNWPKLIVCASSEQSAGLFSTASQWLKMTRRVALKK